MKAIVVTCTYKRRLGRYHRRAVTIFRRHHYWHIDEIHRIRQSAQEHAHAVVEHIDDRTCDESVSSVRGRIGIGKTRVGERRRRLSPKNVNRDWRVSPLDGGRVMKCYFVAFLIVG